MNFLGNLVPSESVPCSASILDIENRRLAIRWLMNIDGNTSASADSGIALRSLIECCPNSIQSIPEVQNILNRITFVIKNNTYDPTLTKLTRIYIETLSKIAPPIQIIFAKTP